MAQGNGTSLEDVHHDESVLGSFALVGLSIGVVVSILRKKVPGVDLVPFTLMVFLLGMVLGAVDNSGVKLGIMTSGIENWKSLNPEILLFIFLPPLLFVSAFEIEYHIFRRLMGQAVLLATLGTLISTVLLAGVAMATFDYGWGINEGLLFGAMFGATDPVAVVALLKELGAPETLSVMIEGESLLNDGVGFVLFTVFFDQLSGAASRTMPEIVALVITTSLLGIVVGVGAGLLGLKALQAVWEDGVVAVAITMVIVFGTFIFAEAVHASGVISVVFLGLTFAAYQDGFIQYDVSQSLKRYWQKVEYMVNTVLFAFSGLLIIDVLFKAQDGFYAINIRDVFNLGIFYVMINVVRFIATLVLYPALAKLGYGITWYRSLVVSFAGLRGAVGLIAALTVVNENTCDGDFREEGEVCIVFATQSRMMFHMAGIVLLTLAINGTTSKVLVNRLHLNKQTVAAKTFFEKATVHVHEHMDYVVESLKRHPHYKQADWDVVWKHMPVLSRQVYLERKRQGIAHNHDSFTLLRRLKKEESRRYLTDDSSEADDVEMAVTMESNQLVEARFRFLSLVKASYRHQYKEGANRSWPSLQILIEASNRCQDRADQPLNEWNKHLKSNLRLSRLKSIQYSCKGSKRAQNIAMSDAYNMASTFIRAHKSAVSPFQHFVHETTAKVVETILSENNAMIALAVAYTEEIETKFPEISANVKTSIAVQRLINEMEHFAHKLLDRAEIDERDLVIIEGALENSRKDLNKIHHPAQQSPSQIMRNSPFLLDVDDEIVDTLLELSTTVKYEFGDEIYTTGSVLDCIRIIIKGNVSVTFENGVRIQKQMGDVLGAVEFVSERPATIEAICETNVELLEISMDAIRASVAQSGDLSYNLYREAGLFVLESIFPQFQYANFNLLKSVLPHIRIVKGDQSDQVTSANVSHQVPLAHRRHHSIVGICRPVLFHGGLVIGLRGDIAPYNMSQKMKPITNHSRYEPTTPLLLAENAILLHINAEALANIESFSAYEASQAKPSHLSQPHHSVVSHGDIKKESQPAYSKKLSGTLKRLSKASKSSNSSAMSAKSHVSINSSNSSNEYLLNFDSD